MKYSIFFLKEKKAISISTLSINVAKETKEVLYWRMIQFITPNYYQMKVTTEHNRLMCVKITKTSVFLIKYGVVPKYKFRLQFKSLIH